MEANGGDGGAGQSGGSGLSGTTPELPCASGCYEADSCEDSVSHYFKYELIDETKSTFGNINLVVYASQKGDEEYHLYGKCGGSGGDGGKGALGGSDGMVKIFALQSESMPINIEAKKGATGSDGLGGSAGKNVVVSAICHINKLTAFWVPVWNAITWEQSETFSDDSCGVKDGKNGLNANGMIQPPQKLFPSIAVVVNEYKAFARESIKKSPTDVLNKFYEIIESDSSIQNVYDTLGLVNELYTLEKQFYSLGNNNGLIKYYESLLSRLEKYAKQPKVSEQSAEYKNVLDYLRTAASSKLPILQQISQGSNEDDDNETNAIDKEVIINQYQDTFDSGIRRMKDEAKQFIAKQLIPEIEKIQMDLEINLEDLVNETCTLENAVVENKRQYQRQLIQLRKTLFLRNVFAALKMIGRLLGFLGPYGSIAEAAISGATNLVETYLLDDSVTIKNTLILPPSIKFILKNIGKDMQLKEGTASSEMTGTINKLNSVAEAFGTLFDADDDSNKTRNDSERNDTVDSELKAYDKLDEKLSGIVRQLKNETDNLVINKQSSDIRKLAKRQAARRSGYEDVTKLEQSIETSNEQIALLQSYEKQIYLKLLPMVRNIEGDLIALQQGLQNQSHLQLDMAKWHTQSTLKELKNQLYEITKGFSVEDHIQQIIRDLDAAMATMITVFDRIQTYSDQKELADHIANLNSAKSRTIQVHDQELQAAIDKLEMIISSNAILTQLKLTSNELKQNV